MLQRFNDDDAVKKFNPIAVLFMLVAAILLPACATVSPDLKGSSEGLSRDAMLEDILSVIPQLLEPRSNSIQFGPSDSQLDSIAARELAIAGYGIQRVSADQGDNFFSVIKTLNEDGVTYVRIRIGELELARLYQDNNSEIAPAGPFVLAGTQGRIDPKLSNMGAKTADDIIVSNVEYTSTTPINGGIPKISLLSENGLQRVVDTTANRTVYTSNNTSINTSHNLLHDNESDFRLLLDGRKQITSKTILFPVDSMRLDAGGKEGLVQLLTQFNEQSDLINVVGCSDGASELESEIEGLSLGRTNRVTLELIALGVPKQSILDDACWSPADAGERFPGRGVVVDLMRSNT